MVGRLTKTHSFFCRGDGHDNGLRNIQKRHTCHYFVYITLYSHTYVLRYQPQLIFKATMAVHMYVRIPLRTPIVLDRLHIGKTNDTLERTSYFIYIAIHTPFDTDHGSHPK